MGRTGNAESPTNAETNTFFERLRRFFERLRRELSSVVREAVRAELQSGAPAFDEPEPLLTKEQVAARLNVSPRTVDTLAAEGSLRRIKVRGCVRFHPDAVDAYIQSRT